MTSRQRTTTYKGSTVIVLWKELKPTSTKGSLFTASYMLTSEDGTQTEWREIDMPFHTYGTAVAHALGEAYRFIDAGTPSGSSV
jgi:hypothetical protein